ncbi:MAG: YihY/virulence factor BrkB family protein, partial [Nitrospirae bacterium]|nr:YihY/virulence factor BrkB family protein [Nitrospirota bacterium]
VFLLVAVTCLYRYVPQKQPPWRDAMVGGMVLTLLWECAKHLFSNYVQSLTVYSRMYGSLLVVVLFLLWVYYSAALLLFGAAIVHRLQAKR